MWVTKLMISQVWVGWWLWRAGCISQDTYLLYNSESGFQLFGGAKVVAIVLYNDRGL